MADWIWIMIPLTALMIPIVAVLTSHQQRMAQILNRTTGDHSEIEALRREIAELKTLIHQQAITLDSIAGVQRATLEAPPPTPRLSERLGP
ncbi:MAG TPA: hypothetical protein VHE55_12675 [Fimbriimonadaceae bacterium]|nr:hypothetical protein [Fimbriimonadaceae bacterium]